jgi:hypothetical protein
LNLLGVPGVVWHTNHPLDNTDLSDEARQATTRQTSREPGSSETRLQSLQRRLEESDGYGVNMVRTTRCSHDSPNRPGVRHEGTESGVYHCLNNHVVGEYAEFYVAPGPPELTPDPVLTFPRR